MTDKAILQIIVAACLALLLILGAVQVARADTWDDLQPTFAEAAAEYELDAELLMAIAALESGWGRSELATYRNNLFGWSCWDGSYMAFDSPEACIRHVARAISRRPHGTLEEIAAWYNPAHASAWVEAVAAIREGLG